MSSDGAGTAGTTGAVGGIEAGLPQVSDLEAPATSAAAPPTRRLQAQAELEVRRGRPGGRADAPRTGAGAAPYAGRVSREQMLRDIDLDMDRRLMATLERGEAERLHRMTMATLERGEAERLDRRYELRMRRRLDQYWKVDAHRDFARNYAMRMARLSC